MSGVVPDKDTTYAFQRAAQRRGHQCFHALPGDVYAKDGEIGVRARSVRLPSTSLEAPAPPYFTHGEVVDERVVDFDATFIRKDPPFDAAYLYLTHLLERVVRRTLIINAPRGLRDANEKLYALHFSQFTPRTLVASSTAQVFEFLDEVGGEGVIKPLDGAGGAGVLMLRRGDKNARGIVDTLTAEGKRLCMVQEFLPAVEQGDKRVLLMDGKVLGAINRLSRSDDFRSNIHVGGRVEPVSVTREEQELCAAIAPRLAADGLYFVGLDLIGGRLTEVNVTSPTGIQELSQHLSRDVAEDVIAWAEARVHAGSPVLPSQPPTSF